MAHSECVYIRFFPGSPVDSLQTGEYIQDFKTHLNFPIGKNVKNVRLIFEVIWYLLLQEHVFQAIA
jgi:hypothetical protein